MDKKVFDQKFIVLSVIIVLMVIVLVDNADDFFRKPYWEKIAKYQPTIKPEMIINILPSEGYLGKPIVDWKVNELAFAMANAKGRFPSHPLGYGPLLITMNTMDTGIEPNIRFVLGTEQGDFIVYFTLSIMRDGVPYASRTFMGEDLNKWAKSVGIANEENW